MPGPKAEIRLSRPDKGSSDPKAVKRLARRQAARPVTRDKWSDGYPMPGSENRKK